MDTTTMATPVSFTIRPPTRPGTPSSRGGSSPASPSSESGSNSASTSFRIPSTIKSAATPVRPSPLGHSSFSRTGGAVNGSGGSHGNKSSGPRKSAFGADDDDEEVEDEYHRGSHSRQSRYTQPSRRHTKETSIAGFDASGKAELLNDEAPKGPLVIPALPNRDWRQSSYSRPARKPTYMPEGGPRNVSAEDLVERTGDDVVKGGLQTIKTDVVETTAVEVNNVEEKTTTSTSTTATVVKMEDGDDKKPETLEQQALQAVLNTANDMDTTPSLSIDLESDTLNLTQRPPIGTETDAFRQDILTRPEESTMEDYGAVPIEAFGAALLRGMGWDPKANQKNPGVHEPKKRPAGLGLGATEKVPSSTAGASSSRAEKDRKRKEDYATRGGRGYVPVIRKERERDGSRPDTNTGSTVSLNGSARASRASSRERERQASPVRSEGSRQRDKDDRRYRSEHDSRRDRDPDRRHDYSRSSSYRQSTRHDDHETSRDRRREDERGYDSSSRYSRDDGHDKDRYRDRHRERHRARDQRDRDGGGRDSSTRYGGASGDRDGRK